MDILPIILFVLGVVFLLLGWRWQSPPNNEAMTALKGLAYMKRELLRVQDQVHSLEDKLQISRQIEYKEPVHRKKEPSEIVRNEKSKLYSLKTKEQGEKINEGGVEPKRSISPKYQEVIELAAKGQRIPEIAQSLLLSQDAVMMVLQTQSKGAAK
ncbi:MAG TPA: DNA-binding response regulator [Desulfosporosinus sp.]|nr:DNA-binding response regulator [Desulfosporosinus sp.]